MAKKNEAPEKRGGILGFFDSIKEFFQNLFDKIRVALEFHRRVEDGKKYWDTSPEGQAQRDALEKDEQFGFRTLAQHKEDQVHFPGYHEMQMSESGLLRIPQNIELLWKEETPETLAQRYIACINERFAERPEPISTHDVQAFADVANDIRMAAKRGDGTMHQFVLGNTHIITQVENIDAKPEDRRVRISVSDGNTTQQVTSIEPKDVERTIMSTYTEVSGKGEPVYYIDPKNNTKSVCVMGEGGYDTFTARTVTGYSGLGENATRYAMPNVIEVSGPNRGNPQIANTMICKQNGSIAEHDLRSVVARAFKQADRTDSNSSMFIIGDKIMWVSKSDGVPAFHIAPHQCEHNVEPVTIRITDKMFTDDGKPKFGTMTKRIQDGMGIIDQRVADAPMSEIVRFAQGLHPTPDDFADIAKSCANSIGKAQLNGYAAEVADLHTDTHTLLMAGYERLNPDGSACVDTEIVFDGKCLYRIDSIEEYFGPVTLESNGMFDSPEKALQYVAEQTQGQTWTRDRLGLTAEMLTTLPPSFRDQLPQEYKDVINEYEHPTEGDTPAHDDFDLESHEAK